MNAIWPWYGMTDTQPSPRGAANGCAKVTVAPEIETTLRQSPAFVPFSKHRAEPADAARWGELSWTDTPAVCCAPIDPE